MSIDSRVKSYGRIWADWQIGDALGSGSGGKTMVYKLTRHNHGFVENDVLKVVNIIEENLGIQEMSESYRTEYEKRENESIENAEREVNLMHMLQNSRSIVTYQDFTFHKTRKEHFTAVDLLIRMHKYEALSSIMKKRTLEDSEIVDIGINICEALEACRKYEIVHRDIKPDNIFYNESQYLLGDFGISRILERGNLAQTHKGTQTYAAPEQFNNSGILVDGYDYRVDIYSLGITLYQLANEGHLPFMDEYSSVRNAILERLSGKSIPSLKNTNMRLNNIILKACSYNPKDRYQSATDMLEELQELKKDLRRQNITTEKALNLSHLYSENEKIKESEENTTEAALNESKEYVTEAALNECKEYTTEAALNESKEYVTEAALNECKEYTTEAALNESKEYATEAALNEDKAQLLDNKTCMELESLKPVAVFDGESKLSERNTSNEKKSVNIESEINSNSLIKQLYDGNNDEALKIFRKMIAIGIDNDIYYEIIKIYGDELIIKSNPDMAIFWLIKCTELSKDSWQISLAEYQLGEIYSKGMGVKRNHRIAENYYKLSASKGNPYAKKKFVAGKYIKK